MEDLARAVDHLELSSTETRTSQRDSVVFRPLGVQSWLEETFGRIPRYLFRVYSVASAGLNNEHEMLSADVAAGERAEDVLQKDDQQIAIMLNEHLRWEHCKSKGDNFISWTTSLPFALCYAAYKAKRESITLSQISICIIDTTRVPQGSFLRDLDLMEAYKDVVPGNFIIRSRGQQTSWSERGLSNLLSLRRRLGYYFGEYLSQGRIELQYCSNTVRGDKLINPNLRILCPRFDSILNTEWAKSTISLRLSYADDEEAKQLEHDEVSAAIEIANWFDRPWRMPIFAYTLALRRRSADDEGLLEAFRTHFESCDLLNSLPSKTMIENNTLTSPPA